MFDAVLKGSSVTRSRIGTGAVVSVLLHAAGLAALIWISTPPELRRNEKDVSVKFVVPPPPALAPPPPPPVSSKKTVEVRERKALHKPDTVVQPKEIPKEQPPEAEPEQADVGPEGGAEGGVLGGVIGGVPGGVAGSAGSGAIAAEPPKRIEIDESYIKLQKISGATPQYSEKAIEKSVEGTMVLKCVVTAEGAVNSCRVLKSLPYMDSAAIDALEKWRFKPYTVDGKPIDVNYTFRLKLSLG
jgi:periplasmic protein TonB